MPRRSWTNLDSTLQRGLVNARATLGLANGLHELFSIRLAEAEEDLSIRSVRRKRGAFARRGREQDRRASQVGNCLRCLSTPSTRRSVNSRSSGGRERPLAEFDDQFIATPAHTLEDIGMKLDFLTVIADMKDGPNADVSDRMVFSLIRDIERMTDTKILR